jgi:hypothetical protein
MKSPSRDFTHEIFLILIRIRNRAQKNFKLPEPLMEGWFSCFSNDVTKAEAFRRKNLPGRVEVFSSRVPAFRRIEKSS